MDTAIKNVYYRLLSYKQKVRKEGDFLYIKYNDFSTNNVFNVSRWRDKNISDGLGFLGKYAADGKE